MRSWRQRLVPYWLLGPGLLWLIFFFVVPMYFMGELALRSGSLTTGGFDLHLGLVRTSPTRSPATPSRSCRSFFYAGTATMLALLIAYPLAYAIAFRAGRYKTLLLFAVIAPFFTTYLIRTIAWKTILSDDSPVVERPADALAGARGRARAGDLGGGDRRPHLQLPAVHDPAALRQPRAARPAPGRGGQGPLLLLAARPSSR